jgi:hypothetical protein
VTRIRIIIGLLLLSLVSLASVALAASPVTVIIPLETIVKGDPGEILSVRDPIPVSELDAEPGWFCTVAVIAGNGESEHDGSNLIIGSNGDEVKALDVEASAGGVTEAAGTLTLGETVTFDGQLGEDGVISAGMNVVFECFEERPPPSTTTTTVTVTTTVPPTSTSTTTIPTTTTTVLSPSSTTTTNPTVSTTVPPDGTTSTTEVPPPTLIESGDAGYIGEADDGHEHGDEGFDWLFFGVASVFALGTGVLAFFVVKRIQERS